MLKIRMQRVGRINQPAYRIVVTEHTAAPKAGKFVEKLGTYNPRTKTRALNETRIKYWLSVGAKPSDTMHNMLVTAGVISGKKVNVLPAYKAPASPEATPGESAATVVESETKTDVSPEASAKEEAAVAGETTKAE